MTSPLMPKATALWLIDNTTLTFEQIADFCKLHVLEIQAIADEESAPVMPFNPIVNDQLTEDEIKRCEADSKLSLQMSVQTTYSISKKKERKYTPIAKRSERPDAIAWILRNASSLSDKQIVRLLGTTVTTIESVRNRTHRNSTNIKPRCPVTLGLCKQAELDAMIADSQES